MYIITYICRKYNTKYILIDENIDIKHIDKMFYQDDVLVNITEFENNLENFQTILRIQKLINMLISDYLQF